VLYLRFGNIALEKGNLNLRRYIYACSILIGHIVTNALLKNSGIS